MATLKVTDAVVAAAGEAGTAARRPGVGPELLTVLEAGHALGVSRQQVVRLEQDGRLPAVWSRYGRLFRRETVERLAAERRARPARGAPRRAERALQKGPRAAPECKAADSGAGPQEASCAG
jgi:excisionase family DNA binding protein